MAGILVWAYAAFISIVALLLTAISLNGGKRVDYKRRRYFNPKVLVIIPCKGRDIELERNLRAAMLQDYPGYDAVAVVESTKDQAFKSIKAAGMRHIIQGYNCMECSGKVKSIASALDKFKRYDAYALLDSDVLVSKDWLANIIMPLEDRRIGISTSFPIFRPIGGVWSWVKFVWGFVGMGLMESRFTRFGWGGTLAFRRDLLSSADMRYFGESISDDMALTHIAKRKKLGIAYVPAAKPIVESDDTFWQFAEWSNRQTALSISGTNRIFYYGVAFYSASILVLLSAFALSVTVSICFLLLLAPFLIGAAKTYRRADGSLAAMLIYPSINFIYLANLLAARRMKSIKWRGRVYKLQKF